MRGEMNALVKAQLLPVLPIPGLVALVDAYLGLMQSPRLTESCRRQKDQVELTICLRVPHDGALKDVLTLSYIYKSSYYPTDTFVQLVRARPRFGGSDGCGGEPAGCQRERRRRGDARAIPISVGGSQVL